MEAVSNFEHILLSHDPKFTLTSTFAATEKRKHQLFNAFVRGVGPEDNMVFDPSDLETSNQLHLSVERIRVPEAIWQPALAGLLDSAGLIEVIGHVLNGFSPAHRDLLTKVSILLPSMCSLIAFNFRISSSLVLILS